MRGAWSSYLELVVEPPGWLAVLLPSLDTARALGGQEGRRGAVTVQVMNLFMDSMEAEVSSNTPHT